MNRFLSYYLKSKKNYWTVNIGIAIGIMFITIIFVGLDWFELLFTASTLIVAELFVHFILGGYKKMKENNELRINK